MTRLKRLTVITLLSVIVFGLNGCISIIEKINFNKDGSGEYELSFDMGNMMMMLKNMDLGSMMGEGGDGDAKLPAEAFEKRDTIINLYDVMAGSTENVERADFWKKANIAVKMDSDAGVFLTKIKFPFEDTKDITFFYENLSKVSENGDGSLGMASGLLGGLGGDGMASGKNEYTMKGRKFTRKAASMSLDDMDGMDDSMKDQLQMVKMFMASATYTTVYSFGKKVKSASNKESIVSEDKKTVTTEVSLVDMLEGNSDVSNEIKLKLF
jgi:hypothetical protein